MKKIIENKFLIAIFMILLILSCNKEEAALVDNLNNQTLRMEDMFQSITSKHVQPGRVLYIEFTWNKAENTAVIDFIEEREPDFFVLEIPKPSGSRVTGPSYTVECSNGSKSWTKSCDSKLSCGTLIKECLDQGGCASICQKKMVYLGDEYNTFYVY